MIRPATEADMESIVRLWLESSVKAHDFASRAWWEARAQDLRELYLPLSDVLVVAIDDATAWDWPRSSAALPAKAPAVSNNVITGNFNFSANRIKRCALR